MHSERVYDILSAPQSVRAPSYNIVTNQSREYPLTSSVKNFFAATFVLLLSQTIWLQSGFCIDVHVAVSTPQVPATSPVVPDDADADHHTVCESGGSGLDQCVSVQGPGLDECKSSAECNHTACKDDPVGRELSKCHSVAGKGTNQCGDDAVCNHTKCFSDPFQITAPSCVPWPGRLPPGTPPECKTSADCPSHRVCIAGGSIGPTCGYAPGAGADECQDENECKAHKICTISPEGWSAPFCGWVLGPGESECAEIGGDAEECPFHRACKPGGDPLHNLPFCGYASGAADNKCTLDRHCNPPDSDGSTVSTMATTSAGVAVGLASARVTMTIYHDMRCSACHAFFNYTLPRLLETYVRDGSLIIEFVDYSLSRDVQEMALVESALCAARQNLYLPYVLAVYQAAERDPKAALSDAARRTGINLIELESCLSSGQMRATIELGRRRALKDRIQGTPTILIDHQGIAGARGFSDLANEIDRILAQHKGARSSW